MRALPPLPPAAFRYKVGAVTVTAIPDGTRSFPLAEGFVRNQPLEAVQAALRAAFLPEDQLTIYFNPLLLEIAGRRVLIDTGFGPQAEPSTVGRLHHNLEAIGVGAATIDTVVISHFHLDHINGLVAPDGSPAFPNAKVLVPARERDFWLNPANAAGAPDNLKPAFANAQRVLEVVAAHVSEYAWDQEILPGLTTIGTPGHTPGHTSFMLDSEGAQLFIQSDLTNTPYLFVRNPGWHAAFDIDPELAEKNRRHWLGRAAAERLLVAGFHYPFPSAAHLEAHHDGFRFHPVPWVSL